MDNPGIWALIWLTVAVVLAGGEILIVGTFFLLPFAAGALVASFASLLGANLLISTACFLIFSLLSFLALKPFTKRFHERVPDTKGLGAYRMIDAIGLVLTEVPAEPGNAGTIKIGAEEWRAESAEEQAFPVGSKVQVKSIQGTRLIVVAVEQSEEV